MHIGIDIVEVPRIAKALNRGDKGFLNAVYTAGEAAHIEQAHAGDVRAAGIWAAKEAVVKAFGVGFSEGVTFRDVEVRYTATGQPQAVLSGKLASLAVDRSLQVLSISISHTENYAAATALVGPVSAEVRPV
ncbi:holo-ACP synthase [Verminephrobacter eiseniae]|uniref:Holo-[acyl-carrier-protein] synthase n=1 Tax=Verminephrobacter eiseniae (strain EF01-2) TaxID=391735 RepID=ACPS_VEREI|nr:holo-ACP synthase [Verminephrobacter eiseniae]A1WKY6.1 RecName: Full=Holo-[acyl-carrier-protein] synthase; Short=Holo-ACP synthase; AltName: Full=4'-phosphopantetheinyl transferase AcpS [Verminephrobacter eiseniae EF01-2]ABM58293.1 holo-acyl-carrier-protein synthase [Verminephrobacter eiseniae EF01-2]MCW5283878.1 holo-ACP synthase [Verminephrobacter eiseniae]MCW5301587.1 holo-ACP synthase [Verminephrobacter eiseniae]MCW8179586.1 holo-ACP synthase [Verminephrobacter eiseniae]MCW8189861.1 ho